MQEVSAEGVRKNTLNRLNEKLNTAMAEGQLLDEETLTLLCHVTRETGREVLLMTDDKSTIRRIFIGDAFTVSFGDNQLERTAIGLNRIRVIHTHPGGNPRLSEEDCSAAIHQKLQCMIAVGVPNLSDSGNLDSLEGVRFGIGLPFVENDALIYRYAIVENLKRLNHIDVPGYAAEANRNLRALPDAGFDLVDDEERAILLGIDLGKKNDGITIEASMTELERLVETADGKVLEKIVQSRDRIDPVTYLGKGKLQEIARLAQNTDANLIVTNDELNSNQIACIEQATGCKCIDRTTVILDIFARHAKTREGNLQVELAQQRYRLAHLKGLGKVLSRTGGGIGTRGPGEKKLETDRRHIHRQIDEINKKLEAIDKNNTLAAKQRTKNKIRTVALAGYTNSGKSTLFNLMTDSDVVTQDGLFITLDSTIRQIRAEYGRYLMSDTVGFIEKLPHDLVTAFRTTLKEVVNADLILHVVDAGNPDMDNQIEVVDRVLTEIGAGGKPLLMIYNKMDTLSETQLTVIQNMADRNNGICISALNQTGIEELNEAILSRLNSGKKTVTFMIPYSDSKSPAFLHAHAEVLSTDYETEGLRVTAEITPDFPLHRFEAYLISENEI